MADEEQVRILQQGTEAWNAWRRQMGATEVNLRQANLPGANLPRANLRRANLIGANLSGADLSGADLTGANLGGTDLTEANLSDANLGEAHFNRTNLSDANLSRANLIGAKALSKANLNRANLNGANIVTAASSLGRDDYVVTPPTVFDSIERLGTAETKDVQQIAASQLELLSAYHQVALGQSNRSFRWALIGSGLGLLLFVVAVAFSLLNGLSLASIVPLIAGAIVNVVSGIVFVLYGKTTSQLSAFHSRLEVLQRYMLANSICESLSEAERDKARAALIGEISRTPPTT